MKQYLSAFVFWNLSIALICGVLYGLYLIGPGVMLGTIIVYIVIVIPIFLR